MQRPIFHDQIGADPEVFIYDAKAAQYVSAHTFIPGTKKEPLPTHFGGLQVDGVSAEFNIKPCDDVLTWIRRNNAALGALTNLATKANPNYVVSIAPVATFDKKYFNTLPPSVLELGCDPDFSAYTGMPNPSPQTNEPFRTGSGHIHFGWYASHSLEKNPLNNEAHLKDCVSVVKLADFSIFLLSGLWDQDRKRRTLYGNKGAFRPKPYGVEYRSPSNAWLKDNLMQAWVFNTAMHILHLHEDNVELWKDEELRRFMDLVESGKATKEILANAHSLLVDKYKFPFLPKNIFNPSISRVG